MHALPACEARNLRLAFKHFNESAFGGSSDGMFNLASMPCSQVGILLQFHTTLDLSRARYLTGSGTEQSFQKAVLYYTQAPFVRLWRPGSSSPPSQALDRGHTPAAYSLAVMHLNGIGSTAWLLVQLVPEPLRAPLLVRTVRDCDIAVNLLKKVRLVPAFFHGLHFVPWWGRSASAASGSPASSSVPTISARSFDQLSGVMHLADEMCENCIR